jgi:transcriptional regulator with XRE-family HTH domain
MTASQQIASQLRAVRLEKGLSLRALATLARIPASTLEGYEAGSSVPAEKLARIADALDHRTFKVDEYHFTVSRAMPGIPTHPDQLSLDFTGEYSYAKARIRIAPGKITIYLDGKRGLPSAAAR